ncbi:hypothetical protein N0V83_001524 [Neocucurbitaria cava]|uniref:Uncharacterized protein n=1 Tax=Neocucurbitaria cava TaxID=798079 RepID=A0A9W8YF18_9PLEO|nr:hypothetical protein N0V83_001524 [Neocucurbitaria cava]
MPITAVIRASSHGPLQQIQIGAADIVATVSAAHSAWGWIGGLTGISNLLGLCKDASELEKLGKLFKHIEPDPGTCRIIGQNGLVEVEMGAAGNDAAFGGSFSSRLIGLTFCALAHNMQTQSAVGMCVQFIVDGLFKKALSTLPGAREAVMTFLVEKSQVIINEGIVRHLPTKFDQAIADIGIQVAGNACNHSVDHPMEAPFILGFFIWLTKANMEPYHTRSAAVARLAASLRIIGYKIGAVQVWRGHGERPKPPRTVVLVTSGSSDTDRYAGPLDRGTRSITMISHYRWNTVGAMLWNAQVQVSECPFETYQSDFEDTDSALMMTLHGFQWAVVDLETAERSQELQAYPIWENESPKRASHIARRLASLVFRESVERIAFLYEPIATESYLAALSPNDRARKVRSTASDSKESRRFFALSISICLAVLAQVGGNNFRAIQHSTTLNLMHDDNLRWLCYEVDRILCGGCRVSQVIRAIATMHCAKEFPNEHNAYVGGQADPSDADEIPTQVVGWKLGRYAVLPNLLFCMDTPISKEILDLHCVDEFIANIPTRRDGSVHCPSVLASSIFFSSTPLEGLEATAPADVEAGPLSHNNSRPVSIGHPDLQPADKEVYISLERSAYIGIYEPDVTLCGRVEGVTIGRVGIQDVLRTLALSWNDGEGYPIKICSTGIDTLHLHDDGSSNIGADTVYNMPVSRYTEENDLTQCPKQNNQAKEKRNVFVQVSGNTPWALLLAGQSPELNRVSFGCANCAVRSGSHVTVDHLDGYRTIIGYN